MQNKFIPLSIPNFKGNELKYVTAALTNGWVSTAGNEVVKFEHEFSQYLKVQHACAVQSGTAALHLCLRHYGITKNDIVLVPTLTFIATINPIIYQNAEPLFFDCDEHLCINALQVEEYLNTNCRRENNFTIDIQSGKKVKAIIPVHIFGECANMDKLMELAQKYNLVIIEDATEALGTKISDGMYIDKYAGTIGHAAAFSFNGNKIITTGGGGMIVSNDAHAIEHMRYLSQQAKDDSVYFINNEIGYNYRLTNLQAALGIAQLEQLNDFLKIKRSNYKTYNQLLYNTNYSMLQFRNTNYSNCWFYTLLTGSVNPQIRDNLINYLYENKIQTRPIWKLNHQQKPFLKYRHMPCVNAEKVYVQAINLPCSTNLTTPEIEFICDKIKKFKIL